MKRIHYHLSSSVSGNNRIYKLAKLYNKILCSNQKNKLTPHDVSNKAEQEAPNPSLLTETPTKTIIQGQILFVRN